MKGAGARLRWAVLLGATGGSAACALVEPYASMWGASDGGAPGDATSQDRGDRDASTSAPDDAGGDAARRTARDASVLQADAGAGEGTFACDPTDPIACYPLVCDPQGMCVECIPGGRGTCDPRGQLCRAGACVTRCDPSGDADNGCGPNEQCTKDGFCAQCSETDVSRCFGFRTLCSAALQCVECLTNTDCPYDAGFVCGWKGTCVPGGNRDL